MKRDVFISYSRKDSSCVKRIKKEIESYTQVNCWMDLEAIVAGSRKFRKVIVDGINNSHVFLFMLSEHSQESDNAIGELELALRKSRETKGALKVVLVNIDNCRMNDEFYLSYCQMDIINWEDEEQKEKLLRDIKRWIPQLPPPPNENRWVFLKKRAEVHISKIKERWKTFFKIIAPKINSTKRIIVSTLGGCTILVIGWIYIPQIVVKYYNNEASAWHAAKQENTLDSYKTFIESNGRSKYVRDALFSIVRIIVADDNPDGLNYVICYEDSILTRGDMPYNLQYTPGMEARDSIEEMCARWNVFISTLCKKFESYEFDREYSQPDEQEYLKKMVADALILDDIYNKNNLFDKNMNDTVGGKQFSLECLDKTEANLNGAFDTIQRKLIKGISDLRDGEQYAPKENISGYKQARECVECYFNNRKIITNV